VKVSWTAPATGVAEYVKVAEVVSAATEATDPVPISE